MPIKRVTFTTLKDAAECAADPERALYVCESLSYANNYSTDPWECATMMEIKHIDNGRYYENVEVAPTYRAFANAEEVPQGAEFRAKCAKTIYAPSRKRDEHILLDRWAHDAELSYEDLYTSYEMRLLGSAEWVPAGVEEQED
jgi:hypothetical protein